MATSRDELDPVADGRRSLAPAQIALAVGGALLVLVLLWFLVLRPDEPAEDATTAAPAPTAPATPAEEPDPDSTPRERPVETFEVFAPKDPFDPLISPSTGGGAAAGSTAADGTAVATTGDGTTTIDTSGDGTGTTGGGSGPSGPADGGTGGSQEINGHRVRVVDVYSENGNQRAQVQVDGTVYTVDEGERFADNFRLTSASGRCATMLYGDDQFTLCEGEEILK